MINYLKGFWKLWKIGFDLQSCHDPFYLHAALKHFLRAESKDAFGLGQPPVFRPMALGRPWIVRRLPQFSEAVHVRVQEIRMEQDAKLSRIRIKKRNELVGPRVHFNLPMGKNSFVRNNEALFLTFTGHIDGVDREV